MKKTIPIIILALIAFISFPIFADVHGTDTSGAPIQGGDIDRNPAIGLNFLGGVFKWGAEFELDFALSRKISLAPRLGLMDFGWFAPGLSVRFAIIKGKRPHGFWIGPAVDFIFASDREIDNGIYRRDSEFLVGVSGEFGYKYTFSFGLYLQALVRFGYFFAKEHPGFYWTGGVGAGYAF